MISLLPLFAATVVLPADDLLVYHRADGPTLLRFDPDKLADQAIDPRVGGNFVEHLGGVIYDGIWAQCLSAPTLEPVDDRAFERHQNERWQAFCGRQTPYPWQTDGDLRAEPAGDATVNGQSLRLSGTGGLHQGCDLPLHRTRGYRGRLFARCAAGQARLRVVVRKPDGAELGAAEITLDAAEWRAYEYVLALGEGGGNRVDFRLEPAAAGAVEVDNIELFPDDAVDGMDPDIIRLSREWRIPILRYPGGNFVSGYHWRDGVGPHDQRRTMANPAWGGTEYNTFGTDEFMRFCDRVGTEPMICVNMGNGTPEEAAAWVEYCNGAADTPMGALRAANGHPEPYGVRVWEVGNEIYGSWQIGHCDAAENLRRYNAFAPALLAVDPTIELIACGEHGNDRWQETLLAGATPLSCISEHPLVHQGHMPRNETVAEMWPRLAAHPWWYWRDYLPHVRRLAADAGRPEVKIAVTEWGIISVPDPRPGLELPHAENMAGAAYAGCLLNALLRRHDMVELANITGLLHGGGLRKRGKIAFGDPQYYVSRLYADAYGGRVVACEQTSPGYDADSRNGLRAVPDVPWLDALAVQSAGGESVHVFLVNRSLTDACEPAIDIAGWRPTAGWQVESGGDPLRRNSSGEPEAVTAISLDREALAALRLPALSVTRVDFERAGR